MLRHRYRSSADTFARPRSESKKLANFVENRMENRCSGTPVIVRCPRESRRGDRVRKRDGKKKRKRKGTR